MLQKFLNSSYTQYGFWCVVIIVSVGVVLDLATGYQLGFIEAMKGVLGQ